MTSESQKILEKALELSPTERAELIEKLFASFDFPSRREIDEAWAAEVEDRISAYERGELKATPVQEVFERFDRKEKP